MDPLHVPTSVASTLKVRAYLAVIRKVMNGFVTRNVFKPHPDFNVGVMRNENKNVS